MSTLPGKIENRGGQKSIKSAQGQALLILLLVLSVVLTVVLSSISRTVTDISVSEVQENSQRAFNAAEAGIEEALISLPENVGSTIPGTLPDGSTFSTNVQTVAGQRDFVYPARLTSGDSAIIWFVEVSQDGTLRCTGGYCFDRNSINQLCWGTRGTYVLNIPSGESNQTPAILLSVYYDWDTSISPNRPRWVGTNDFSNVKVAHVAYDPVASRRLINGFLSTSNNCQLGDKTFSFRIQAIGFASMGLPLNSSGCYGTPGCLIMAKMTLLYNNSASLADEVGMRVPAGGVLPAQGFLISSTGIAGESTRKLSVFQSFPEPPFIFNAALTSSGGIVK